MLESVCYSAPSNIAIIKYMGKTSTTQNLPTNPSISYTLNHLRSFVTLRINEHGHDRWEPLVGRELLPIELSEKGRRKFLDHLARLKKIWSIDKTFTIRSANNFPSDCGIASSSSSFAALTLAAVSVFEQIQPLGERPSKSMISALSRLGSGSSCRSFFEPWALWTGEGAREWPCDFDKLNHLVILLDSNKKDVSSSEAHLRVVTSPLFSRRLKNVSERISRLERAKLFNDWNLFCDLAFEEFQEMHELFETSVPSFSYRTPQTMDVLEQLTKYNQILKSKILVTMDAGNNIHCMNRDGHRQDLENLKTLFPKISFIDSWSGSGTLNV